MLRLTVLDDENLDSTKKYMILNDIPFKYCGYNIIGLAIKYFTTIIKFLHTNEIEFSTNWEDLYQILGEKRFDDFIYLHKIGVIGKWKFYDILNKVCAHYDLETIDFVLSFNEKFNLENALRIVCYRNDDQVKLVQHLLNHIQFYQMDQMIDLTKALLCATMKDNIEVVKLLIHVAQPKSVHNLLKPLFYLKLNAISYALKIAIDYKKYDLIDFLSIQCSSYTNLKLF